MSEVKDPAFKLFGKTICLLRDDSLSCSIAADQPSKRSRSSITTTSRDNKNTSGEFSESKQDDECTNYLTAEESAGAVTSSRISDDDKTHNPDKETQSGKHVKKDDESETNSDSQDQKTLKKPDKILPCPRCNSRDTKFCYYNNYNVNQPRHFCKNCQRYWTAGGSMRNVPVGSGRRKNKASASNFRHIMVSEALHAAQFDVPSLKPNGTVLTFGSDNRSMVSVLNCVSNGCHQIIPAQWGSPLIPTTLKIEDPNEAAKSSIWCALGIKNEKVHSPGGSLFKAFNSKDDDRVADNSVVLQANPAALSRSLNFQERT